MSTYKMYAGWGDMDFNSHMANTAYINKSGDSRMRFFSENGFPTEEFTRLRIGPVVQKDELHYFREIKLLESFDVSILISAMSEDGSRFSIRNEFFNEEGVLAAKIDSSGGWMDLIKRRLVVPPVQLQRVMDKLPKTDDFYALPPILNKDHADA